MAISDHHLIGIRKSLVETHPWLPVSVYKAFREAKAIALAEVRDVSALNVTLPWVEAETLDTIKLMGKGYWKCGIADNAAEIEAITRYSYEQLGIAEAVCGRPLSQVDVRDCEDLTLIERQTAP